MRVSLAVIGLRRPQQIFPGDEPAWLQRDFVIGRLRPVHVCVRGQALGVIEKVALREA